MPILEGHHFQNAYVTRDIDKWIKEFERNARIDHFSTWEGTQDGLLVPENGRQVNKLAFIWVGDMQFELIQPVEGDVSIYTDALPEDDGLKFHHICMRVPDWDTFRARVDDQRFPVVLEGHTGMLKFLYLDMRAFLGHYVEYVCMSDDVWRMMGGR